MAHQLSLPVSMEDEQLFPRDCLKSSTKLTPEPELLAEMWNKLSRLWWSRMIIACRGHLSTFFYNNEEKLFCFDDAFIHIHKSIVEGTEEEMLQVASDCQTLNRNGLGSLETLADGFELSEEQHPFFLEKTQAAFSRLFGLPGITVYHKAQSQAMAYLAFLSVLLKLQMRWKEKTGKKSKSIRFEEDPEWQPDDRVVIFREFFKGNRTWVMMDFDRHVLKCWRPRGVNVIFGDRYTQRKLDEGFKLCGYCGMLESLPEQFVRCPTGENETFYCSKDCFENDMPRHSKYH